jgi:twitching motility protein PilT
MYDANTGETLAFIQQGAGSAAALPASLSQPHPAGGDAPPAMDAVVPGQMHPQLREYLLKGYLDNCTDIHLRAHDHPVYRGGGKLYRATSLPLLSGADIRELALSTLNDTQRQRLERQGDCDLSLEVAGAARYRINVFLERGRYAIAARVIPEVIPSFEQLGLPANVCQRLALKSRGLVLVTGPTGSGKTTTLASMVDYINEHYPCNIITIEDPIEYRHLNKQAVITQREVGHDTADFSYALRSALRQDPDVILVGEMRDLETMRIALTAAETGHLVLGTLHTNSAVSTVERIVDSFAAEHQPQIRLQLSMTLRGIVCQSLLPSAVASLGGRVLACEVLINNMAVSTLIREVKPHQLHSAVQMGTADGMRTFDMDLIRLIREGKITMDQALSVCHKPEEFRQELGGVYAR